MNPPYPPAAISLVTGLRGSDGNAICVIESLWPVVCLSYLDQFSSSHRYSHAPEATTSLRPSGVNAAAPNSLDLSSPWISARIRRPVCPSQRITSPPCPPV